MADFEKGFSAVVAKEGFYSDDPDDPGRETVFGITRRFHPDWRGWPVVERMKAHGPICKRDKRRIILRNLARELYLEKYWKIFGGDSIPNQQVADRLLDISVNLGVIKSALFAQQSLNLLNHERCPAYAPKLKQDGIWGRHTISGIIDYLGRFGSRGLLTLLNGFQLCQYIYLVQRKPPKIKFLKGWLKRLDFPEIGN